MKENIFAPVFEIIDQSRTMQSRLEAIRQEEKQITNDYCALYEQEMKAEKGNRDFEKLKAARQDKENKLMQNERIKLEIEILLPILHENARTIAADILKPYIADILQKYAGKKPGPKTAEKMRADFNATTGCNFYFDTQYTNDYFTVYANNYYFRNDDFKFSAKNGLIIENGKVTPHPADDLTLANCPAYTADPMQRVNEIISAFQAIKDAESELEKRCRKFNEIIPRDINLIHHMSIRNYIKA